jgi:hypothetical protein
MGMEVEIDKESLRNYMAKGPSVSHNARNYGINIFKIERQISDSKNVRFIIPTDENDYDLIGDLRRFPGVVGFSFVEEAEV